MFSRAMHSRARVAAIRGEHPDWTLGEIGDEVGITRERVRQLLAAQGLPTSAAPRRYGPGILVSWVRSLFASSWAEVFCVSCRSRQPVRRVDVVPVGSTHRRRMIGVCGVCGGATSTFVR